MARPLRIEYENAFYHVIQRGIERKRIFDHDQDKEKILSYLNSCHLQYKAIFHSYVFMDNHYHLIIQTPQANLSRIMHYLNTSYAVYFNTKYKRTGPLYQSRYKALLVQQDGYLDHLSCYIHLNPVRAGIVKSPQNYRYSSCTLFVTGKQPPGWFDTALILSMFGKNPAKAKQLYIEFVRGNIGKEKDYIKDNTRSGIVLGDEDFFQEIRDKYIDNEDNDTEIPALKAGRHTTEPSLDLIKSTTEKYVKNGGRLCRSVAMYLSRKYTQKKLVEIAIFYGDIQYTAISLAWRRMGERLLKNKELGILVATIEKEILRLQSVKCKDLTP